MKNNGHSGELLEQALSLLLPDVFFNPIWTQFVEAETPLAPQRIQLLLDAADKMVLAGNLGDACRILFICAFQQLRAGDYTAASSTIQRILVLAERHGLSQVAWWATWGAAAVCVRRGWYQQAAEHLEHLQSMLGQQHEWVLSGVIEMIRQALLSQTQAEVTVADQVLSADAVLSSIFMQLQQWGAPLAVRKVDDNSSIGGGHMGYPTMSPPRPAGYNWRRLWWAIKRIVKGELQLKWVEPAGPEQVIYVDRISLPVLHPPLLDKLPFAVTVINETSALPAAPAEISAVGQDAAPTVVLDADRSDSAAPAESSLAPRDVALAGRSAAGQNAAPTLPNTDRSDAAAAPRPAPKLTVYALGSFHLAVNDIPMNRSITGKSKMVFAYMLMQHAQAMPRDILMDVFWPDARPESARNRLNVALHHIRQALRGITNVPVVLYEDGAYSINPDFDLWIDADEFERHVQKGRQLEASNRLGPAIKEYELARDLYQGDFMADEPYEDWPVLTRERLRMGYLGILDRLSEIYFDREEYTACAMLCQSILTRDNCREDAHCLLMRCYSRQGQRHLALRQYQTCVEALRTELDVDPALSTTQLYERIRRRERA